MDCVTLTNGEVSLSLTNAAFGIVFTMTRLRSHLQTFGIVFNGEVSLSLTNAQFGIVL